ncbi:MAG: carbohydrate porin [Candidatus Omnitrophica bacterium]|nr:carbohydrate porin [Candidatus Omnitrophota bacterium]MDD4013067.1 carbohydrate porin [Candidatus Omnitrophota bacterium]
MRFRKIISCVVLCGFTVLCVQPPAFGGGASVDEDIMKEFREMKELLKKQNDRIEELEKRLMTQDSTIAEQKKSTEKRLNELSGEDISARLKRELGEMHGLPGGLDIGAGLTMVGQGAANANNPDATDGKKARFDGSYSADLEIGKDFDDFGRAFIHLEAGQGDTVESELSVFSNVNRDAGDSNAHLDITEAWYEHYLFDKQITITGGKIDATCYLDTNAFANDETAQFLGHIFRNSAVIDWPDDNGFGARMYLAPEFAKFVDVEMLYMNERGDWENLFDNPFIGGQFNFMPAKAFGYDEEMWEGNYRVLFWYNGAAHSKVKDPDVLKRGNAGFGFSMDQKITDVYGVFGRFGWANPTVNDLAYDWSFGGQMTGKYWNREDDVVAVAIGQVIPGKEYRDINEFHKAETHIEAYYSFQVNKYLTLSPDMQIIWDPNGGGINGIDKDAETVFVYGIRGQVSF